MSDLRASRRTISMPPQCSRLSPEPAEELVNEILSLELEVLNLERFLLSRYQEVFERYLSVSFKNQREDEPTQMRFYSPLSFSSSLPNQRGIDPLEDSTKISSGRLSFREYLRFSLEDDASASSSACQLSKDMIRCMSSIFIKLSDNYSTLSSIPFNDGLEEVVNFSVDADKFNYVESMMQQFKSFILRLEDVDPKKMENEEKLAFWVNIHNALVMHAFLAYGPRQHHMRSSRSIMKAAYKVGGSSVSVYEIQRSILGCPLHNREMTQRLRAVFLPFKRFHGVEEKHPYAMTESNPLVYFALCLGAYSDPPVRVYTSRNILRELDTARQEYLQSNVSVHKETKILLPRLLLNYAKAASMDLSSLLKTVHDLMPESHRKVIEDCVLGNPKKIVRWLPHRSSFRFVVQRYLLND